MNMPLPQYDPPPRGITQHPLVRIAALISIALWWRWTYTQEPVYGRLLRKAGSFGFVALAGSIAFVIGVERQVWWIAATVMSIVLFLNALYMVSERSAYNKAYLADVEEAEEIEEIIAEMDEFSVQEARTRTAETVMAARITALAAAKDKARTVRIGDEEIDVDEYNQRHAEVRRRALDQRGGE